MLSIYRRFIDNECEWMCVCMWCLACIASHFFFRFAVPRIPFQSRKHSIELQLKWNGPLNGLSIFTRAHICLNFFVLHSSWWWWQDAEYVCISFNQHRSMPGTRWIWRNEGVMGSWLNVNLSPFEMGDTVEQVKKKYIKWKRYRRASDWEMRLTAAVVASFIAYICWICARAQLSSFGSIIIDRLSLVFPLYQFSLFSFLLCRHCRPLKIGKDEKGKGKRSSPFCALKPNERRQQIEYA